MTDNDPDYIEIRPAQVDLTARAAPQSKPRSHRGLLRRLGAVAGLLVLLLVAAAVILVLPDVVEERGTAESEAPAATPARTGEPAAPAPGAGPAGSAATAQAAPPAGTSAGEPDREARAAAQEALQAARELESELADRGAADWAAQALAEARAALEAGQAAYNRLDYATAAQAWSGALETLRDLKARIPAVLQAALDRGTQALDAGDAEAAAEAFADALVIDPGNADALAGQRRAGTLDEVLALLEQAGSHEQAGELSRAREVYQQAADLDPQMQAAVEGAGRMRRALVEQRYRAAMSAGFSALEGGDLGGARTGFEQALKIRPGDRAARSALDQVKARETDKRLDTLLAEGRDFEAAEDWFSAVVRYDEAVKLDASLVEAANGLARARQRADLDVRLEKFIKAPERLRTEAVRREAATVLDEAGRISAPGPRLRAQMAKLARLVDLAATPVNVTLTSDGMTEVTVFQVGRLGRFAKQQLQLLPGTWVALGQRDGYRDTRVEFTVAADGPEPVVKVVADQRIAFGGR